MPSKGEKAAIRHVNQRVKKNTKELIKKQSEILIAMENNLCKKPFGYRFRFAWWIIWKRNPFTGQKIMENTK